MSKVKTGVLMIAGIVGVIGSFGSFIGFLPSEWISQNIPELLVGSTTAGVDLSAGKYVMDLFWVKALTSLFIILILSVLVLFYFLYRSSGCEQGKCADFVELTKNADRCSEDLNALQTKFDNAILQHGGVVAEKENAVRNYDKIVDIVSMLANKQYPGDEIPQIIFQKIQWDVEVRANGDCILTQTYEIMAKEKPLHFWSTYMEADPEVPEIVSPFWTKSGREFVTATDLTNDNNGIAILPYDLSQRKRRDSIYFLPAIPQDESRKFKVSYFWEGWAQRFIEKGMMDHELDYSKSLPDIICEMKVSVEFDTSFGVVECENKNPHLDGDTLNQTSRKWVFENPNRPLGRNKVLLTFKQPNKQ
ncbi:hypothetical protein V5T82_16720 [Magnetovibrio sp. PR-2]|uniref:hypothetical protein n=1 Tax=Magnetovibrio sp. PR-2 TaxID=3120356 RepID=UPI002FCDFF70